MYEKNLLQQKQLAIIHMLRKIHVKWCVSIEQKIYHKTIFFLIFQDKKYILNKRQAHNSENNVKHEN